MRALVEREMLDATTLEVAIRRLRASGAVGLIPSDDDLIAEAAAAEWEITELVARALLDPTGWREITTGIRRVTKLLHAVFHSKNSMFVAWVERAIDAACTSYPELASARIVGGLLALSWLTDDVRFARAMTSAVREVRRQRGYLDDPVPFAARMLASTSAGAPQPVRSAVVAAVLRATLLQEHAELLGLMGF
jgi:hypothetical protein